MIYLLFLLPCFAFEIAAIPLAFVIPHFPHLFPSFLTPDNPITGDQGHQERTGSFPLYWQKVLWLLRNRAYNFKLNDLGCEAQSFKSWGNVDIKNRDDGVAGWMFLVGLRTGHWYFKFVLPIGFSYCIQWAFGWQLNAPIGNRCLYMFSPRLPSKFIDKNRGRTWMRRHLLTFFWLALVASLVFCFMWSGQR